MSDETNPVPPERPSRALLVTLVVMLGGLLLVLLALGLVLFF